jgi:hypothetical protein
MKLNFHPPPPRLLYSHSASKSGKQLNKISLGRALIASSESALLYYMTVSFMSEQVSLTTIPSPLATPANPHT